MALGRNGRDPLDMEVFLHADGGAITWSRDLAQPRQIVTRCGFVCHGSATASAPRKLTFVVGHLTESGVD